MTVPTPAQSALNPPVGANEGANKAIFAGLGGAVSIVAVYIIDQFLKVPLPPEIVASVQTIIVTVLVFFIPRKFGSQ